ncbi:MAG TPA: hypothetical protein VHU42_15330 [Rhodopila sp.]|nr:hypothetical protein [Rhodopila sp.]
MRIVMRTTSVVALLVMLCGAGPVGPGLVGPGLVGPGLVGPGLVAQAQVRLLPVADAAHTLFQPNLGGASEAGRVVQLPRGGYGVTTGGTPYYQTFGAPGGGGVMVPNGNGGSSVIGSGGHIGTGYTPG